MITDIGERIAVMRVRIQDIVTGYDYVSLEQTKIMGGLYRLVGVRIGKGVGGQDEHSCCGWVNPANGDIYYSGGWKSPARNPKPRASVLDDDFGANAFGKYGVKLLREMAAVSGHAH